MQLDLEQRCYTTLDSSSFETSSYAVFVVVTMLFFLSYALYSRTPSKAMRQPINCTDGVNTANPIDKTTMMLQSFF